MSQKNKILSDSSFYICFLDDIKEHNCLLRIISEFEFYLTPLVKAEIKKSENYKVISDNENIISIDNVDNIGEILKPFFSKDEILSGEHEIIGFAYILYQFKVSFYFILDDKDRRDFVEYNFKDMYNQMLYTVQFICLCCCFFRFLSKNEVLTLFKEINESKFRIKTKFLNKAEKYIEVC